MRALIKFVAVALGALAAFLFLGPYLPEGFILQEWAVDFREALSAFWGYPVGFSSP